MAEINDWNTAAASNNSAAPDGWPEGMTFGSVNNTAREGMAVVKRGWSDSVEGNIDSTGSANAYLVAANRTITAYYDGMRQGFHANFANTGAATLDIDSVGAKSIKKNHDVDLASGDIEQHQYVEVVYSASDDVFQMVSPVAVDLATTANTFTKTQTWSKGADVASAAALTLGSDGNYFDITGTTAITSINTVGAGAVIKLHFDAALTLTHHATDLILPGGANITTAAGDEAEFVEYASGDWRCTNYSKATGKSVVGDAAGWVPLSSSTPSGTPASFDITSDIDTTYDQYAIVIDSLVPATDNVDLHIRISTGATFDTGSNYRHTSISRSEAGSSITVKNSSSDTEIVASHSASNYYVSNNSRSGWRGVIYLENPGSTTKDTYLRFEGNYVANTNGLVWINGSGRSTATAAVDGVQFYFSSGNIDGTNSEAVTLYGIKKP